MNQLYTILLTGMLAIAMNTNSSLTIEISTNNYEKELVNLASAIQLSRDLSLNFPPNPLYIEMVTFGAKTAIHIVLFT